MEADGDRKRFRIEPFLGGAALLLLLIGCFYVLKPFMTALMWAIILTYSLHPLQRMFTRWFRGSRTLAAIFVTLTLTVVFAGPITLISISLAQDGKDLATATRNWFLAAPEVPPPWIAQMPVVGSEAQRYWTGFAEDRKRLMDQIDKEVKTIPRPEKSLEENGNGSIEKKVPPAVDGPINEKEAREVTIEAEKSNQNLMSSHIGMVLGKFFLWAKGWLFDTGLAVTRGVTQVLLSAFLAFFMLRDAPVLAERLRVAADRLAGSRGKHLIKVAGDTVRGVIYGILGTAIAQALVAGLGFWIAGVPGAVLLSVLTFFFAVMPFGPPLIWIPAAIWLFAQASPGWGIFMGLWGLLAISSVDNFLRPYLISHGSKMPFILIFCGVIGGAFAFGLVGVFLGPTLLAVAFRLIEEWSSTRFDSELLLISENNTGSTGNSQLHEEPTSETPTHGVESLGVR